MSTNNASVKALNAGSAPPAAAELSSAGWLRLERVVERFERAWQRGERPAIDSYLPASTLERTCVLLELVHADLECRLKAGDDVRAEVYLKQYPELTADRAAVLELIAAEYRLRQCPDLDEYQQRFPQYEELRTLLRSTPVEKEKTACGVAPRFTLHDCPPSESTASSNPADSLSMGSHYRVLHLHAEGGLGEVLVAEDAKLRREVALKLIKTPHANDPDGRRRFLLEAEITSRLEHPGIVPVYGIGQAPDGRPFYAMRFIQGETLQEAVQRFHEAGGNPGERSLAFRQLLGRFIAVCNTVAYAHSRGILHRDLKPSNIMLGKYGETLLMDWGLSKRVEALEREYLGAPPQDDSLMSSDSQAPTQQGRVLGTPAYMSPEQAAGQWDRVGPASDIYGLGATLYMVLTGRPPFADREVRAVLEKARRGEIVPPRQANSNVPRALEAICLKAMALRSDDRYASALDLAAELEHWLADEPVSAYVEHWTVRWRRWFRRNRVLVTSLAVAVLAAVVTFLSALVFLTAASEWDRLFRQYVVVAVGALIGALVGVTGGRMESWLRDLPPSQSHADRQ